MHTGSEHASRETHPHPWDLYCARGEAKVCVQTSRARVSTASQTVRERAREMLGRLPPGQAPLSAQTRLLPGTWSELLGCRHDPLKQKCQGRCGVQVHSQWRTHTPGEGGAVGHLEPGPHDRDVQQFPESHSFPAKDTPRLCPLRPSLPAPGWAQGWGSWGGGHVERGRVRRNSHTCPWPAQGPSGLTPLPGPTAPPVHPFTPTLCPHSPSPPHAPITCPNLPTHFLP